MTRPDAAWLVLRVGLGLTLFVRHGLESTTSSADEWHCRPGASEQHSSTGRAGFRGETVDPGDAAPRPPKP